MTAAPTVAHLLPPYNPFPPVYPAGTELRVEQVSLRQRRYRPVVICGGFPGQSPIEEIGAVRVRRIAMGRLYRRVFQKLTRLDPWPYAARMWRIVRDEGTRVIHIHNEPRLLSGLAPHLIRESLPTLVHVANEKPIPREQLGLVTRWVACSRYMKEWLQRQHGIASQSVEVIYTGVDTESRRPWWECESGLRAALRRRFGIEDDNTVAILFAGRIVKEKGVRELLDAFSRLRQETQRPLMLLLAGNVRKSDDPRDEKAVYGREMASRMGRDPGVKWVGSLAPRDMHEFLVAGDVFALSSVWPDPFPTVMLEAAAAGLPILGSALGGIVEFLEECPEGALVKSPLDADEWAARLKRLAEDADLRRQQGGWLRARVEQAFSWDRVTADFESLYDRVLAG